MKKQRKMVEPTPSSITSKKKKVAKREVLEKQSALGAVVKLEEKDIHGGHERLLEGNSSSQAAAAMVMVENQSNHNDGGCYSSNIMGEDWRTWLRPQVLVDEQMSWGSVWFSFWEQEDESCDHHAMFYSDVFEEDDIWDLRSIKQVPQ